ncbi:MAG: HyaD/HybD family hydrogenase maturation endopeptidase [Candidatus Competibacteraceae bacterium]|nr:HyaD/HybD family hydrogenase maturation endopeptidase [Candidatus Competibacteraceae bacterium]
MHTLVLGIGNLLLQDEGIGVHIINELQRRFQFPPGVELLDGGTAGMELVEAMLDREQVVVVDAIRSDEAPGTLIQVEGDAVPAFLQQHLTPHQLGIADVLATLTIAGRTPKQLVLLGVVPHSMELSVTLSDTLQQQFAELITQVAAKLAEFGIVPTPKVEIRPSVGPLTGVPSDER